MSFVFRALLAALFAPFIHSAPMDWQQSGPHRSRPLEVPTKGGAGFTAMGIPFTNRLADSRSLTNQIFLNGSGVAAGDVDGDGRADLYFCGLDNRNELFRNLGNWRFESITDSAGVGCPDHASTGATFADVDGDHDLDLLVNGIASGTRLLLNNGRGTFTEATQQWGLNTKSGATSLTLADIDGDGFLDLYVVNYRSSTFRDEPDKRFRVNNNNGRYELLSVDGRAPTEPDLLGRFTLSRSTGLIENGETDQLYRNISGTRFEPVSWNSGVFTTPDGRYVEPPYDWGLSAMFHDVNGDGTPDLYVCNDFQSEDRMWINDGRGKFRLSTKAALAHISLFSMGVDFADLDGDGRDEIFVADMLSREHARRHTQLMDAPAMLTAAQSGVPQYSRNTLFWNRGDGSFAEIGQLSRLAASEWSWCPAFLDVDLDGYSDLIITAGHERDAQNIDVSRAIEREKIARKLNWREQIELRRRFPKLTFPLMAFRNNGNLTFDFKQAEWGFDLPRVAQGMALSDLDNDGDLDLAVNCLNSPALLYRNNTTAGRVGVRLRGKAPNTRGIGARIRMVADSLPEQSREVIAGGRYLSGDDAAFCFAAGAATNITLRVRWRNGGETIVKEVSRNRLYELSEEDVTPSSMVTKQAVAPLFEDVSTTLNHTHQDQAFDDFRRQPLIPHKLSGLGPGVAWYDCDGDGWEELLIGSGRTGRIAAYHNKSGQLQSLDVEALCRSGTRDRTSIIGWQNGANRSILIGSANYEDGLTNGPALRQFNWKSGEMDDAFPGFASSSGPMAMADADGDGDLDLFLGGRVMAARFPEPASSHFFRNENGKLVLDEKLSRVFGNVGLVSAATWSDLDGNGSPELLLACQWGPIRIFTFRKGSFAEITADLGFDQWTGPWNSIAVGDFDNDGRMDIVAGNWGRNTVYGEHPPDAWHLYYAPSASHPSMRMIEAYFDAQLNKMVPLDGLEGLASVFPDLLSRYPTFASFSVASIRDILGEELPRFQEIRFNTIDSMVFLNRGSNFVGRPLPLPAQFSAAFGLAVGDVNADGNVDLFVAQNFFGLKQNVRSDAGQGLLLLGNGAGEFSSQSAQQSGITIRGEGRAAAFCDYDHDGRLDFVVTENSASTHLYHNKSVDRGLRVVLTGEGQNLAAVGASVRAQYQDGAFGPRHEVHAGEGYWSQAGGTIVLGRAKEIKALEVRSAAGAVHLALVARDASEVRVQQAPRGAP